MSPKEESVTNNEETPWYEQYGLSRDGCPLLTHLLLEKGFTFLVTPEGCGDVKVEVNKAFIRRWLRNKFAWVDPSTVSKSGDSAIVSFATKHQNYSPKIRFYDDFVNLPANCIPAKVRRIIDGISEPNKY